MELDYALEAKFTKPGEASNYGGTEFSINYEKTNLILQADNLANELKGKYRIPSELVYKYRTEALNIDTLRYMNVKYLAPCFVILDAYENEESEMELQEFLSIFFQDNELFNEIIENLSSEKNEKSLTFRTYVKKVLFTYTFKLWSIREGQIFVESYEEFD